MSEYTTGPWHVGPHYKSDVESSQGSICECKPFGSSRSFENAKLIALAPELLEVVKAGRYCDALKRFQEKGLNGQIIPGTDELDKLFMDWHNKGHKVIKKLEG